MRARGFTVGCPARWSGLPQFPQLLGSDDLSDVAGTATPIERVAVWGEVPVVGSDGLELAADAARLPPAVAAQLASGMDALVLGGTDEAEVVQSVVLLVSVDVMDLEPSGDAPVDALPDGDMGEAEPSVNVAPEVARPRDVEAVWPFRLWTAFTHAGKIGASQSQDK
jgi:hypothetical protein